MFLAAERRADMLYNTVYSISDMCRPTATFVVSHSCRKDAFLWGWRLVFQRVICVLLRNPVARFVEKITWTRNRLKRNSMFGAEDGTNPL
jgi:hypothetical protein